MTIEKRTSFLGFERTEQLPPDKDKPILTITNTIRNIIHVHEFKVLSDNEIEKVFEFRMNPLFPLFWFAPMVGQSLKGSKNLSYEQINDARIQKKSFIRLKKERIIWKP